jgi:hypothetical protein
MTRFLFFVALCFTAAVVALAQPSRASAGWCWPTCSSYGYLGQWTSTHNGCWFSNGEVCSWYASWFNIAVAKTCYPGCDANLNTTGVILYGFEDLARIRGRFTQTGGVVRYLQPSDVGMGPPLRAQVTWYGGPASQINVGAIG